MKFWAMLILSIRFTRPYGNIVPTHINFFYIDMHIQWLSLPESQNYSWIGLYANPERYTTATSVRFLHSLKWTCWNTQSLIIWLTPESSTLIRAERSRNVCNTFWYWHSIKLNGTAVTQQFAKCPIFNLVSWWTAVFGELRTRQTFMPIILSCLLL